jgi:hypothetical protein
MMDWSYEDDPEFKTSGWKLFTEPYRGSWSIVDSYRIVETPTRFYSFLEPPRYS